MRACVRPLWIRSGQMPARIVCLLASAVSCAHAAVHTPPYNASADARLYKMLSLATEKATAAARGRKGFRGDDSYWLSRGHSAQVLAQIAAQRTLALSLPKDAVACDLGFNAGHSAIMWLEGTSARRSYEFDEMAYSHSAAARAFVQRSYPGRTRFFVGDTTETFAAYADAVEDGCMPPCDLVMADAGHQERYAYQDFFNAVRAAHGPGSRRRTVFVADDVTRRFPGAFSAWQHFKADGAVRERNCTALRAGNGVGLKGWCTGTIERRPAWASEFRSKLDRATASRVRADLWSPAAREQRDHSRVKAEMLRNCDATPSIRRRAVL